MVVLYIDGQEVGQIDDDGQVLAYEGRRLVPIGSIRGDGTVCDSGGTVVGRVNAEGHVFNESGNHIGVCRANGSVSYYGFDKIGRVKGSNSVASGAAMVLLFPWPNEVERGERLELPWWAILIVTVATIGIIVLALAFVVGTALVWGAMLGITAITAYVLSSRLADACSAEDLSSATIQQVKSKRGEPRDVVTSELLDTYLKPWNIQFLAVAPALWYGLVILTISAWTSASNNQTANIVLFAMAYAIGAFVSVTGSRRILKKRLSNLLIARINGSTVPTGKPEGTSDWNKLSQVAASVIGLTALTFILGTQMHHSPSSVPKAAIYSAPMRPVAAETVPLTNANKSSQVESEPTVEPGKDLDTEEKTRQKSAPSYASKDINMATESASATSPASPPVPPPGDGRILHEADLKGHTPWELTLMRNEPYARHGYRFTSAKLQNYYNQQTWYQGTEPKMAEVYKTLSPTERINTQFILDYQKQHGLLMSVK